MADPTELQRVLDDALLEAKRAARAMPAPAPRASASPRLITRVGTLEQRLPPITPTMRTAPTFLEAVRESGIPGLWVLWIAVREAMILGTLAWVAVIAVSLRGGVPSLVGPVLAAVIVRGLWLVLKPMFHR